MPGGLVARAWQVLQGEALLDALCLERSHDLLALMREDSKLIRRATGLRFEGPSLEPVGDPHASRP